MIENKHAPAPWNWDGPVWGYDPEQEAPWLIDAEGKSVLHGTIRCSSEADARLIAAAPELLAALQSALAVIEDYRAYDHDGDPWKEDARLMGEMEIDDYDRDGRLDAARALIDKVTGVPV